MGGGHLTPLLSVDVTTLVGTIAGVVAAVVAIVQLRREVVRDRLRRLLGRSEGEDAPARVTAVAQPKSPESPAISHLERVRAAGVLRCGCVKHPPLADFTYAGDQVAFSGLYPTMAYAVAAAAGLEVLIVTVDWSELDGVFEAKGLDLVLSVFETRERCAYADFVCPFYRIGLSGVARADDPRLFADATELNDADVKVVVTRGEAGWETAAMDLRIPKRRLTVLDNADLNQMMDIVRGGTVDIAICDDVSCDRAVKSRPELRHVYASQPLGLCSNAIMIPKGDPEFAEWVDERFTFARLTPQVQAAEEEILASDGAFIRRFR